MVATTWVATGKLLGVWFIGLPIVSLLGTTSVPLVRARVFHPA